MVNYILTLECSFFNLVLGCYTDKAAARLVAGLYARELNALAVSTPENDAKLREWLLKRSSPFGYQYSEPLSLDLVEAQASNIKKVDTLYNAETAWAINLLG